MTTGLANRNVLVIGASSGIGRAFAEIALRDGANVVVAARRIERLDELVKEAGGGVAIEADVTDATDCARLAEAAVAELGRLDLVLCSVGAATVAHMLEVDSQDWDAVLATNVKGVNQAVRSVLPYLGPEAIVAVISSEVVGNPRAGLGAYGASKAAVDQSLLSWREEHPEIRFLTVTIGGTLPTGFADHFDPSLTARLLEEWVETRRMQRKQMDVIELARLLEGVLGVAMDFPGVAVEHIRLRAPSGMARSTSELRL